MAFYDDRRFLLSYIRHAFVTCDDTGMCEMVMLNDNIADRLKDNDTAFDIGPYCGISEPDQSELGHSYDIASDMELIGAHRRRSNTAQRLERLKKERKYQAKIKTVPWKDPQQLTGDELHELFPKKDLVKESESNKISALTEQLEKFPAAPSNPFNEYARYDARVSEGAQTKKVVIFLTMLPPDLHSYPMTVVTLLSAKVQDLIGLICWQYTNECREPKLRPSVAHYSLRIAEENGEVDEDFPSLDPKEPVSKFGFPVLALVEKGKDDDVEPVVTIHMEDGLSKVQVPNLDVTVQEVLDHTLRRRTGTVKPQGREYRVEKQYEPGTPVDLHSTLANAGTLEFSLIWEDAGSTSDDHADEWVGDMTAMEAPLFQSFTVFMIHKLGKTEVQLGISGEKVEINPVPQKGSVKFWSWQQKAATYKVEHIAVCQMISRKQSAGKAVFKLVTVTGGGERKSQLFETDVRKAQEIVKKLQYILDMHYSPIRKEYLALQERKMLRKQQNSAPS